VLFPNLVPYAKWNAVSVYSPARHVLRLEELTPTLIADNLTTQVQFARAVIACDPSSTWTSVNANHLPPSGSSVLHPHLQGSVHPTATTAQRAFADLDARAVRDYLGAEHDGERFIGSTEAVVWLASFAPAGLAEVRALVTGSPSPADLGDEAIAGLAAGLSSVLAAYTELGFQSFNLAMHGAAGSFTVLRLVARAYFGPLERSDVMWSERLHGELATDVYPEEVASLARKAETFA
jgi:UDPglucose--hexose-1-phosphate uridylyltransferase